MQVYGITIFKQFSAVKDKRIMETIDEIQRLQYMHLAGKNITDFA
jgi:hypothetical protein